MFKSNGRNQRVDRGEGDTFRARPAKDGRRLGVGRKPARLEHLPLREVALDLGDIAGETLQDFGDDNPGKRKGLCFGDHAAQFGGSRTGRRAEKIDLDGTVDQDQTRFLREALTSPFQMPVP